MEMKTVIGFLNHFIQKDYEARRAYYLEPEDEPFQQKVAEVQRFYAEGKGIYDGFSRGYLLDLSEEHQASLRDTGQTVVPRALFQVRKYEHPSLGELYRAYLGGHFDYSQGGYDEIFYLAHTKTGLSIVSIDIKCLSCLGKGKIGEEACTACEGKGWEYNSGIELGDLGRLVEVCKLQAPTNPTSLADYESA